jgi:DNA (cytosine-5)-methyltransferase 1
MTLAIRGRGDSYDLEYRQDGIANAILTPNGGRAGMGVGAVAIGWSEELTAHEDCAGTVQRGGQGGRHEGVMTPEMAVRRLTPVECERLQGFPDSWTKISDKTADGPRYKTIGNSMAVPCMNWIGRRIDEQIKRFSSA